MKKEYIKIANLNLKKYTNLHKSIITKGVILTFERIKHIQKNHKLDFELYFKELRNIIRNPDYVLEDIKNKNTILIIKHVENTNINIIIKLATQYDAIHNKNSIMTFYRVRDRNLTKLKQRNTCIYKRE